jgi:trans-aconitate 2-methyltransferase
VGWRRPWNYATADDTDVRLRAAGFVEVSCWLEPKSVTPADARAFVQTVCLVRHLDPLPEELHDPFIDAVLARSGTPLVLHYVRLNMTATR